MADRGAARGGGAPAGASIPEMAAPEPGSEGLEHSEEDEAFCLICLGAPLRDRTVLPACSHGQFCFDCIFKWSALRRTCPLCNTQMGPFLIHDIHSEHDYSRFYLRPTHGAAADDLSPSSASPSSSSSRLPALTRSQLALGRGGRRSDGRRYGRFCAEDSAGGNAWERDSATSAADAEFQRLDAEVAFRRHVYRSRAYAQHVGSNRHSRYGPPLTSAQFAKDGGAQSRAAAFIRRELRAWPHLDDGFLAAYCLQVLQTVDVQSDAAIRLLSDFLGGEDTAHHFTHELTHFLRSPYRSLREWDRHVQYVFAPPHGEEPRRTRGPAAESASERHGKRPRAASIASRDGRRGKLSRQEQERTVEPPEPPEPTGHPPARSLASRRTSCASSSASQLEAAAGTDTMDTQTQLDRRQHVIRRRAALLERLERERHAALAAGSASNAGQGALHPDEPISDPARHREPQPPCTAPPSQHDDASGGPPRTTATKEGEPQQQQQCEAAARDRAREARLRCLLLAQRRGRQGPHPDKAAADEHMRVCI